MRIAYISYEYPPDTAVGGIATYTFQIVQIMKKRGHDVEVFSGSIHRTVSENIEGINVHRVLCTDRSIFNKVILPFFETRNNEREFDVIESPEFSADGLAIKLKYPGIPLVVKLHTPWFLIDEINNTYFSILKKARFILSGIFRGRIYNFFWRERNTKTDQDYLITMLADQIHTPSISLGNIISTKWNIPRNIIHLLPNPYIPKNDLLSIPINSETNTITYIGRLEIRKGLVALSKAVRIVLKKRPTVKFRFVGSIHNSPIMGMDMKTYLLKVLENNQESIEFLQVSSEDIYDIYAQTDICVFPSIWENFPNTCLEAMSAGRGIVASKNGGMKDMLEDSKCGILINALKPSEIANALILLLDNKDLRQKMAENARKKILASYNQETIGQLIEQRYKEVIH